MSDNQFVGEIRLFPYNWVPQGWLACNGQQLSIQPYVALYSIIGSNWGGDGKTYFDLPNLNGQAVMGVGPSNALASKGGSTTAPLNATQIPAHNHTIVGTTDTATTATASNTMYLAHPQASGTNTPKLYSAVTTTPPSPPLVAMGAASLPAAGNGSAPAHSNVQPNLVLNFCICWEGIYPDFP